MAKKTTTKYLKFKGTAAWCRLYDGQEDDFNGVKSWKMNFYPDIDTIALMKAAGIQLKLKDDDGEKSGVSGKYFVLKRPLEKEFSGEIQKFLPAEISDKDGTIMKYKVNDDALGFEEVGERIHIGNGSTVEVTLEVYPTKRYGNGTRLKSLKILDLIEWIPPEDLTDNEVDGDEDSPFEPDVSTEIPDEPELVVDTSKTASQVAKSKKVKW